MNKKHMLVLTATGLALMLAGCSQQSSSNHSSNSSSLLTSKSSTKISADNLTPQQMVSLVTTYAGNKYGQQWYQTAKDAKKNGLQVDLYPASNYKLADDGQGVAYNVKASGKSSNLVYTIQGNSVNIYQGASASKSGKKLTTVSRADMVKDVNNQGQADFVNQLAQNAQVNDKRGNGTTSSPDSHSASDTSGKYGNQGPVNVPDEMQGTWYSVDDYTSDAPSITFGKNTMQYHGGDNTTNDVIHLYKQDSSFMYDEGNMTNQAIQDATQNWRRTDFFDHDGIHWLHMEGWCQSAGAGVDYAVHTETIDGQQVKVLVAASGARPWTDSIYYQTPSQAQQNKNTKFDDLHYRDDEDD